MSIFGWSYPAGCSGPPDTDSPDEALADAVYELMSEDLHETEDRADKVFEFVRQIRSDAYAEGYRAGKSDEGLARDHKVDFVNSRGE